MANWFLTKLSNPFNEERTVSLTNGAKTTGLSYITNEVGHLLHKN